MAGTVREAKLESPTSRSRLGRGRKCRWRTLLVGRAHLGWRRWKGKRGEPGGQWLLRRYIGFAKSKNGKDVARYRTETLGLADDVRLADGERVLDFNQAIQNADARLNSPKRNSAVLTVREAMANYIVKKREKGQPTNDLEWRVAAHIYPTLGDLVVAELTTDQINSWLATLASAPAFVRSKRGKPQQYKPQPGDDEARRARRASANRVLSMLKAALNRAWRDGKVDSDAAWRRVEPFESVDAARVRYLTVAEARRLINAGGPEFRPLVQAALATGARYGELIALRASDFNPDSRTIHVRTSKTGKGRHIVLNDEGAGLFRSLAAGKPGDAILLSKADGTPWKAAHQARPMKEACKRAKIAPPVGIHQLRHTWASHAVMNGVPLLIVAKNLGHTDTRMVEKHYGHLAPSYVAEAIKKGAPRFGFKPDPKIVTI
jgi:integrase